MREPDFAGLRADAETAVRQPDFATVRQRVGRVRRRRAAAGTAAALAVALAVGGLGYAATGAPGGERLADPPTPSIGDDPDNGWPRITDLTAGSSGTIFTVVERCRTCEPELYASADGGGRWDRRTVPPAPEDAGTFRMGSVVALGPEVLLWRERLPRPLLEKPRKPARSHVSTDGGRTWRIARVDAAPAAEVPAGTRPVDCFDQLLKPCLIHAVDPASGRIAPLAHQPTGITVTGGWTSKVTSAAEELWVPGLDPVTRKPAVAVSKDRGRTWRTHVFAGGVPAVERNGFTAGMYLPNVAAGAGGAAYALLYRADLVTDGYRTVDGGATWQRLRGRIGEVPDPGLVTTDGAHVVAFLTRTDVRYLASRGGGPYAPATLTGNPGDASMKLVWAVAPGLYLQMNSQANGINLSGDGWSWRSVKMP